MTKVSLLATAAFVIAASTAGAQVTREWIVLAADSRTWLGNTDNRLVRGATYDPVRDEIYVASREAILTITTNVARINPATGADISITGLTGLIGGTFALVAIDVDEDATAPKIYMANLQTTFQTLAFKIYRISTPGQVAVDTVFNNSDSGLGASAHRAGDTLQVVGSGTSTEIFVGTAATGAGTSGLVRFTTVDGNNFTVANRYSLGGVNTARARLGLAVSGTGVSQRLFGNTTGSAPVAITLTGASTSTISDITATPAIAASLSGIGYAQFGGRDYIALSTGNAANQPPEFYELTGNVGTSLGTTTSAQSGSRTNADGTGSAFFDTTRKRAITFYTNNSLASHSFAPPLSVSDWSVLNEE